MQIASGQALVGNVLRIKPGTLPVTCVTGDLRFQLSDSKYYFCAANTWTQVGSGSGGGTWGSITGTLSDQTDLQSALDAKAPTASPTFSGTITTPLTANRVVTTDGSSALAASSVTTTTLGYLDATSSIQTQLDAKAPLANPTFTGTVTGTFSGNLTGNVTGNADTATTLAANPNDCASDRYATTIAASGDLTCAQVTNAGLAGSIASSKLVGTDIATVGTITSGTWNGSVIDISHGGTNNGSLAVTNGGVVYTDGSKLVNSGAGSYGQILKSQGAASPTWVGPPLISDRELISNTDIEVDASGYTAYADAAGATPVDCTGGSPSSSVARSTTTPITGTGELLWTKSGSANRQGEGFSIPFTVGTADQAKVLQLDVDSIVRSGTFTAGASGVDSDLEFYIYDVTNSTLIQPTTYKIYSNNSSLALHTVANFQTSSSGTSYRLCVHTATTSTSNYTVGFDNISIHPSRYVYGTPITDWQSWTPTGSWSSNTTYTGYKRRVGDSGEYQVRVATSGAPTSASLTINQPSGETIDTSKGTYTTASRILRNSDGTISDTGVAIYQGDVGYSSSSAVAVLYDDGTGKYASVTQAAPMTFGSGDYVEVSWSTPIVGWSSSVQMSDSSSQRVVAFSNAGGTVTGTLNSSFNKATYPSGSTLFDTHGVYSSGTYTVGVAGKYLIMAASIMNFTATASGESAIAVYINSVKKSIGDIMSMVNTGSYVANPSVMGLFDLKSGDTIEIYGLNGNTSPTYASSSTGNYFYVFRLGGDNAIGATETISMRAHRNASDQTSVNPNNSAVKVAFNSVASGGAGFDDHGWFDTSNNRYTVGAAGKYCFSANVTVKSTNVLNNRYLLMIYKNGSEVTRGKDFTPAATTQFSLAADDCIPLVSGDYLEVFLFGVGNNSASTLTIDGGVAPTHFQVHRIGL